ncbi:PREDICTED: G-protein coupled receptor 143-like [Vollenhovia emeryi]|uniref:G-protein coupled receptor 143-like n=1 Tax=Vollenhovia emeryi TaxID=411798 RepID=UPI0005F4C494|nr:PREDICTED: G-protein coupled receptor 143-like [Vollenhovia emeryi]
MADPTLQTFCCHQTNRTDRTIEIMQEFNTDAYNTVCMLSSTMGMMGAIYQILPREDSNSSYRWRSFSRGRDIIVWLAVADLLASLGVFVRSALWRNFKSIMPLENDTSNVVFCAVLSAWIQYFYMATWIWTLCYAVDMRLLLGDKNGRPAYYHALAWMLPAVLTTCGLIILYMPNANCHNLTSLSSAVLRILPNYFATYVLLAVVMIANPILYVASTRDLETAVLHSMAQMTGRERRLLHTIRLKFALINLVYYVCWTPNLINGVLLWILWFRLPIKAIIALWYIMAVTNPLQAFFNAIVYQSWTRREKLRLEFCQDFKSNTNLHLNAIANVDRGAQVSESSPLLNPQTGYRQKTPHVSINGSSSL